MTPLELTEEEIRTLRSVLQSYRQKMLDNGMVCHLPKQYDNVVSILHQIQFNERSK